MLSNAISTLRVWTTLRLSTTFMSRSSQFKCLLVPKFILTQEFCEDHYGNNWLRDLGPNLCLRQRATYGDRCWNRMYCWHRNPVARNKALGIQKLNPCTLGIFRCFAPNPKYYLSRDIKYGSAIAIIVFTRQLFTNKSECQGPRSFISFYKSFKWGSVFKPTQVIYEIKVTSLAWGSIDTIMYEGGISILLREKI